ncbi:MAG: hypothetical protein HYU81_00925 [Candidatus Brennerbacteria bacterium]|nr:hypothetical protein [Candidatus Brennerbacteria bacterium]
MNSTITVCENCKKETDQVILTAFVGDKKLIEPLESAPFRCGRCKRSLAPNEKFFRVTATILYVCKNGHTGDHPDVEAKMDEDSREWEGHFVCEECGEEMKIDGERVG